MRLNEIIDTYTEMDTDQAISFFTNPSNTKFRMHCSLSEEWAFWFKDSVGDTFFFDNGVLTPTTFADDVNTFLLDTIRDEEDTPVWWIIYGTLDTMDPALFTELYNGAWGNSPPQLQREK